MALDPVTGIATAIGDVARMVTKAIPSDELQAARFKQRSPLIYANIRKRIHLKCLRECRHRWHQDIDATVELYGGALLKDEREYMKKIIHSELQR